MASPKPKHLGQILIEQQLITDEQLETALEEHKRTPKSLGRVLIDMGLIKESDLVRALSEQVGLEFVDLSEYPIDPVVVGLLPDALATKHGALPIAERDGKLLVAMSDPANVFALDDIRASTGREVQPVVAIRSDVEQAIQKYAAMEGQLDEMVKEAAETLEDGGVDQMEAAVEDAPIVRLVTQIMTQAVADRASDVHIEPLERDVRVRFRVDGVLHEKMARAPKAIQGGLISRLKVMADLNIAEKRVPQDGRIGMKVGGKKIDLRMATLPTVYGEKVVLRILDTSQALITLDQLGFLEDSYKRYEQSFRRPYGAILVTGPTGSGKSTTMYATLNILNEPEKNIITVEDPVEYRLPGINQMQIHSKAGLTFASALRSILRADPDIIMIGEVRDRETAMIAVESALTGHLVLSSLHTNDAASAITRLTEMDVETFLVASAIDCVVAQRLARKLCERCREPYRPEPAELEVAGYPEFQWREITELYRAGGTKCGTCAGTGYRGRIGLYEVMPMTEELERLTVERASSDRMKAVSIEQGMKTLRDDGLEKALTGLTSIEEVARVVK